MYRPNQNGPDWITQTNTRLNQDLQTRLEQTRAKYADQNQTRPSFTDWNKTKPRWTDQTRPDQTRPDQTRPKYPVPNQTGPRYTDQIRLDKYPDWTRLNQNIQTKIKLV